MAGNIAVIGSCKQGNDTGVEHKHHIYIYDPCLHIPCAYPGIAEYPAGEYIVGANVMPVVVQGGATSGILQAAAQGVSWPCSILSVRGIPVRVTGHHVTDAREGRPHHRLAWSLWCRQRLSRNARMVLVV